MKYKYLFFACDPGGANAIVPIIKHFENYEKCIVYGKNKALSVFAREGIRCVNIETIESCENKIDNLLLKYKPEIVITGTSSNDFFEKKMWIVAKENRITTIAVVDHWTMLGYRFSKHTVNESKEFERDHDLSYTPDHITVIDDYCKSQLVKLGIAEYKVHVMGNPHFEYYKKQIDEIPDVLIQQYIKKYNIDGKRIILFASDNISDAFDERDKGKELYWGYNEKTIFGYLEYILNQRHEEDFIVIIKPHPKEDVQYWYELKLNPNKYIIDDKTDTKTILKASDLVISMQSMVLFEAALCGKKYMSIQIGLKRENPFVLSRLGIAETILDQDGLEKAMNDFFLDKYDCSAWRMNDNSIEKITKFIGELK